MTETIPFAGSVLCDEALMLGEGPTYDPATDTAWWFDIKGQALHELQLETGRKAVHALPFLGSVLAVIDPTRQLIASDQGLFIRETASGRLSLFATLEAIPTNRSNDGRVHPSGCLWISTMARDESAGAGAFYHVDGTTVTRLYSGISIPNSICFSPDGTTAYFTDTAVNHLMRVSVDPATGLPTGDPVAISDENTTPGWVDGSVCDADGLIWNARYGSGAVDVYKPDGAKVARYAVPATQTTCPAFIGRAADRLLVTSAFQNMSNAARTADPNAGKTFELGVPVRGRFEPAFRL
ncbi:MAG: SMP-30/gluconolactonase/LRE family protein [Rhizobium giardinii]